MSKSIEVRGGGGGRRRRRRKRRSERMAYKVCLSRKPER
jgi:hypothetical protein